MPCQSNTTLAPDLSGALGTQFLSQPVLAVLCSLSLTIVVMEDAEYCCLISGKTAELGSVCTGLQAKFAAPAQAKCLLRAQIDGGGSHNGGGLPQLSTLL